MHSEVSEVGSGSLDGDLLVLGEGRQRRAFVGEELAEDWRVQRDRHRAHAVESLLERGRGRHLGDLAREMLGDLGRHLVRRPGTETGVEARRVPCRRRSSRSPPSAHVEPSARRCCRHRGRPRYRCSCRSAHQTLSTTTAMPWPTPMHIVPSASRLEPHSRSTVLPGTSCGSPASSARMRATLRLSSPAWLAQSKITQVSAPQSTPGLRAIGERSAIAPRSSVRTVDRKSTRLNSSHHSISYAVFCLKK